MLSGGLILILSAYEIVYFKLLILVVENLIFFAARFYLFPLEGYRLVINLYNEYPGIVTLIIIGVAALSIFNVVIFNLKMKKLISTVQGLKTPGGRKKALLLRQSSSTSWLGAGELEIAPDPQKEEVNESDKRE